LDFFDINPFTRGLTVYRLFGTDGTSELGRLKAFHDSIKNTKLHGDSSRLVEFLDWETTVEHFPFLTYGQEATPENDKTGFQAIFNGNAGWVDPIKAMELIKHRCERLGVKFLTGAAGTVTELIREGGNAHVIGVRTADDHTAFADITILSLGSYSGTLLDFELQLESVSAISFVKREGLLGDRPR
jgi:sarcosine oxidase / L-pipecolate oxidase